jgi:hypothetical protein
LHLTLFFYKKKKKNQQSDQPCRVRANLTLGREVYLYQDKKAAAQHGFSVIPMKYLQNLRQQEKLYRNRKKMIP